MRALAAESGLSTTGPKLAVIQKKRSFHTAASTRNVLQPIDPVNQFFKTDSIYALDLSIDPRESSSMADATGGHWHWQAIDANRNMARDYHLSISADLFGWIIVEKCWGRIGAKARVQRVSFLKVEDAARAVAAIQQRRASALRRIGVSYNPAGSDMRRSIRASEDRAADLL